MSETVGFECEDCGDWIPVALPATYTVGGTTVRPLAICVSCDDVRIADGFYGEGWEPSCNCGIPCWGQHP